MIKEEPYHVKGRKYNSFYEKSNIRVLSDVERIKELEHKVNKK